jgi:hypothetical protein
MAAPIFARSAFFFTRCLRGDIEFYPRKSNFAAQSGVCKQYAFAAALIHALMWRDKFSRACVAVAATRAGANAARSHPVKRATSASQKGAV